MKDRKTKTPTYEETAVILDSINDGVFTVDEDFNITSFNSSAERITGVPTEEALGRRCWEVFKADICEGDCALKHTTRTGEPIVNRSITILNAEGEQIPISVSTALLKNRKGKIIGGVETFRDLSLVEALRREVQSKFRFADMVSGNLRMKDVFSILPDVAQSGSTVLIEGESGTGKELMARAIHDLSSRHDGPLVTVNCGAIPDALLESELFGHIAGAFTDAKRDKPGKFALAQGGTIFLDEVGDITPAHQVKLLRVLQEKVFEPLGSTSPVKADVRIVTATNRDLSAEVEAGRFRSDLFYRINVIRIVLPPLRERKEDIPLLTDHIIQKMNLLKNKEIGGLSPAVLETFLHHDWPGNVRELENIIERAFILCPGGMIQCRHLPDTFACGEEGFDTLHDGDTLVDMEIKAIREALVRNNWNRSATARELGIDRGTIWRKCKQFGIELPRRSKSGA